MKHLLHLLFGLLLTCSAALHTYGQNSTTGNHEIGITRLTDEYVNIAKSIRSIKDTKFDEAHKSLLHDYVSSIGRTYDALRSTPSVTPTNESGGKDAEAIAIINAAAISNLEKKHPEYAEYVSIIGKLREISLKTSPMSPNLVAKNIDPSLSSLLKAKKKRPTWQPSTEDEEVYEDSGSGNTILLAIILGVGVIIAAGLWVFLKKAQEQKRVDRIKKDISRRFHNCQKAAEEIATINAKAEAAYAEEGNDDIVAALKRNYDIASATIEKDQSTIAELAAQIPGEKDKLIADHTVTAPGFPTPPPPAANEYGIEEIVYCGGKNNEKRELEQNVRPLEDPRRYVPTETRDTKGDGTYTLRIFGLKGERESLSYHLTKPVVTIGRQGKKDGRADVVLPGVGNEISRMHAILSFVDRTNIAKSLSLWIVSVNQGSDADGSGLRTMWSEMPDGSMKEGYNFAVQRNQKIWFTSEIYMTIE